MSGLGVRVPRVRRPVMVRLNGVEVPMYSVGVLARSIQRSVVTVNYWERKGIFPVTPFKKGKGERLFSKEMIEVVKKALEDHGPRVSLSNQQFCVDIAEGWKALGVNT